MDWISMREVGDSSKEALKDVCIATALKGEVLEVSLSCPPVR